LSSIPFFLPAPEMSFESFITFSIVPFRPCGGGKKASRQRRVAHGDCSPAIVVRGPAGSTVQNHHSLLQTDIFAVRSCSRGFDLVTRVTSNLIASSHLQ
jgi:hypothetical protein